MIPRIQAALEKRHQDELDEMFAWFREYDHIFIDDGFDKNFLRSRKQFVFCYWTIIAFAERFSPQIFLWIAMDAYGDFFEPSGLYQHLQDSSGISSCHYSLTPLKNVMRCSENIYNLAYTSGGWPLGLRPSLGHKIQGMCPCNPVKIHCRMQEEARKEVLNEIKTRVECLLRQGFTEECFAIITNDTIPGLLEFLEKETGRYFSIYEWDQVSSLEWPVIIYAYWESCLLYGIRDAARVHNRERQRYRVLSRAMVRVIEITVTWGIDLFD